MDLLKAVSKLREAKGCSTVSLAKELNVSRDTIYKTLSSKKTELRNKTLHGICGYFEISLGDLIKLAQEFEDERTNK